MGYQDISFADLTDDELLGKLQLLLIGDSIALDATDDFYTVFPNSISDAAVSRYTTESYDIYDYYVNDQNWNGDGVILHLVQMACFMIHFLRFGNEWDRNFLYLL